MLAKYAIAFLKGWLVLMLTNAILTLVLWVSGLDHATEFITKVNAVFWGLYFGIKIAKENAKEKKDGNT